jgi:hypothetical protein
MITDKDAGQIAAIKTQCLTFKSCSAGGIKRTTFEVTEEE